MLAFKVPDVGDEHLAVGGMEVVIFDISGDIDVRARSQRLADEGAASPAQHRHTPDEAVNVPVVPDHL